MIRRKQRGELRGAMDERGTITDYLRAEAIRRMNQSHEIKATPGIKAAHREAALALMLMAVEIKQGKHCAT